MEVDDGGAVAVAADEVAGTDDAADAIFFGDDSLAAALRGGSRGVASH